MGLSLGFCCCEVAVGRGWFVRINSHFYYENLGYQGGGFDQEVNTDPGYFVGFDSEDDNGWFYENTQRRMELTRIGASDDWTFDVVLLPHFRGSTTILSQDFSSPVDITFDVVGNAFPMRIIVTIAKTNAAANRPADLVYFPHRYPYPNNIKWFHQFFQSGQFTTLAIFPHDEMTLVNTTNPTQSIWSGTQGGYTLTLTALRNPPAGQPSGFGITKYGPLETFYDQASNTPWTALGVYCPDEDSLVEIANFNFGGTVTRQTRRWASETVGPAHDSPRGIRATEFGTPPGLFVCPVLWPFDNRWVLNQQIVDCVPIYDQAFVKLTAVYSRIGGFGPQAAVGSGWLDAGTLSGTIELRTGPTWNSPNGLFVANVVITGAITTAHTPPSAWPATGETLSTSLFSPKVWMPMNWEKELQASPSGYNWTLIADEPNDINGVVMFFQIPINGNWQGKLSHSGTLPPGCQLIAGFAGIDDMFYQLSITGTPPYGATGSCRIILTDTRTDLPGSPTYVYTSQEYDWIVLGGSPFTITYPSPYSNTATPPSPGFDWRIQNNVPVAIPATIVGGTPFYLCSLFSGSLPPGCTIVTGSGLIKDFLPILGPSSSGSCVIQCVDSLSEEAYTVTYNWQYIGDGGDIWVSPTFFVSPDNGGGFESINLVFES